MPHLAEQRVIKTIMDMRDRHGLSFQKIADFFSGIGIPTKRKQRKWNKEVIRCIYGNAQINQ